MMKIITPFLALVPFLLCSACSDPVKPLPNSVEVGKIVTRTLGGNPSTGYAWYCTNIEELKDKVDVQISMRKDAEEAVAVCGAPAQIEVKCTPLKEGSYTIKLAYIRPWEKGVPPAKTEEIQLNAISR